MYIGSLSVGKGGGGGVACTRAGKWVVRERGGGTDTERERELEGDGG